MEVMAHLWQHDERFNLSQIYLFYALDTDFCIFKIIASF